jgi:hypothetical protein
LTVSSANASQRLESTRPGCRLGKLEKDFVRATARKGPHELGSTSIRTIVVFLPASAKLHLSHSTRWKSRFLAAGNCLSLSRRSPLMPSFWRQLTCWNDREHGHHALWSITSAGGTERSSELPQWLRVSSTRCRIGTSRDSALALRPARRGCVNCTDRGHRRPLDRAFLFRAIEEGRRDRPRGHSCAL